MRYSPTDSDYSDCSLAGSFYANTGSDGDICVPASLVGWLCQSWRNTCRSRCDGPAPLPPDGVSLAAAASALAMATDSAAGARSLSAAPRSISSPGGSGRSFIRTSRRPLAAAVACPALAKQGMLQATPFHTANTQRPQEDHLYLAAPALQRPRSGAEQQLLRYCIFAET